MVGGSWRRLRQPPRFSGHHVTGHRSTQALAGADQPFFFFADFFDFFAAFLSAFFDFLALAIVRSFGWWLRAP